ncbi:hypothetical protein S83_027670, partial [Arachis hypogaea]
MPNVFYLLLAIMDIHNLSMMIFLILILQHVVCNERESVAFGYYVFQHTLALGLPDLRSWNSICIVHLTLFICQNRMLVSQCLFMNGATCYTNESLEPPTMSIKEFASAARKANTQGYILFMAFCADIMLYLKFPSLLSLRLQEDACRFVDMIMQAFDDKLM